MKTFREHINEEIKIGALASGGIDIERDAVRDEINGILAGIAARPCVTPYNGLYKVRKALSYFHIHLPKKVYLEGKHGVEVWDVKQFGEKMGFTDQGDWIKDVPAKYHLFFHYHLMGSMYYLEAKIVNDDELEKLVSRAEQMVAEAADAACRQDVAKHMAPKEPLHDVTSDEKKKGNKEAVSDSEKGLNEVSLGKLVAYKNKADKSFTDSFGVKGDKEKKTVEKRLSGLSLAHSKITGKAKVGTSAPKHPYMEEETLDETHADNIRRKYREKEDSNDHTGNVHLLTRVFGSKKERETSKGLLQKRNKQGYVTGSDSQKGYNMTKNYARRMEKLKEEEQIDEVSKGAAIRAYGAARDASDSDSRAEKTAGRLKKHIARKFGDKTVKHAERHAYASHFGRPNTDYGTDRLERAKPSSEMRKTKSGKVHKQDVESKKSEIKFRKTMSKFDKKGHLPEENLAEKAPPGAKFERMVKHIKKGYSKDGLTDKEKSIAYATAWKAKKKESND